MGDPNAAAEANRITQSQQGSGSVKSIPHFVSLDFAQSTETVLYVMCGIMAFGGVVALFGLKRGRQEVVAMEDGSHPVAGRSGLTRRLHPACRNLAPACRRRSRRCSGGGRHGAARPYRVPRARWWRWAPWPPAAARWARSSRRCTPSRATRRPSTRSARTCSPRRTCPSRRPIRRRASSPATVVYAVDPSSGGLAFHETQTGRRVQRAGDREFVRRVRLQPERIGGGLVVSEAEQGRRGHAEQDLRHLHPVALGHLPEGRLAGGRAWRATR